MRRHSVLIGEDRRRDHVGWMGAWRAGVHRWYNGAIVLVFVEVLFRHCVRLIERVLNRREKGAKGKFVDDVREIED